MLCKKNKEEKKVVTKGSKKIKKKDPLLNGWNLSTHTEYITHTNDRVYYQEKPKKDKKLSKGEREKLYLQNLNLKDDTFKLYGLIKEQIVKEGEEIEPNVVERKMYRYYKQLLKGKEISEEKKELTISILKDLKNQIFLQKQDKYRKDLEQKEEDRKALMSDKKLLERGKITSKEELELDKMHKVEIEPEKTFAELQEEEGGKDIEALKQKIMDKRKTKKVRIDDEQKVKLLFGGMQKIMVKPGEKLSEMETKLHISHTIFQQYMLAIGIDPKHLRLVNNIFDNYGESVRSKKDGMVYKKMNLRIFLFNFKKWLVSKTQMKDLVSTKKAADSNSILREYLKDFESFYPRMRLPKMTRATREVCTNSIKQFLDMNQLVLMEKKDFEVFNCKKAKEDYKTGRWMLDKFNGNPTSLSDAIKEYDRVCGDLPFDLKKKTIICQFLLANLSTSNYTLNNLIWSLDEMVNERASYLERMGSLLQNYKQEKVMFKETDFSLFDIANHIYNQLTKKEDNDLMFFLVSKFKRQKNKENNMPPEAEIDPKAKFPIKDLDKTFNRLCDKTQEKTKIISDFIDEIEQFEIRKGHVGQNNKVNKAIHENLVVRCALTQLEDCDKHIDSSLGKVVPLVDIFYKNNMQGKEILNKKAYEEIHRILEIKLPEKKFLRSMFKLTMNPSQVLAESQLLNKKHKTIAFKDQVEGIAASLYNNTKLGRGQMSHTSLEPSWRAAISMNGTLKESVNGYLQDQAEINLSKVKPRHNPMATIYDTILPTEYYKNLIDKQRVLQENEKNWYVRPHHIETLTDHPYSLKDNILDSNYYSFYEGIERNKGKYVDPEMARKQKQPTQTELLIGNIQDQLSSLKSELSQIQKSKRSRKRLPQGIQGAQGISPFDIQDYYQFSSEAGNYEAKEKAYEGILDELRKKERNLIVLKRNTEFGRIGYAQKDWYMAKNNTNFAKEMKKFKKTSEMDAKQREYLSKLQNTEMY